MNRDELEALIAKYLGGELSSPEAESLLAELRLSENARRLVARHLYHERTIQNLLASTIPGTQRKGIPSSSFLRNRWNLWTLGTVAAAALLAVMVGVYCVRFYRLSPAPFATVELLAGQVFYDGDDGPRALLGRQPFDRGMKGLTSRKGSSARLEFQDGTSVVLMEDSLLDAEEREEGKRVSLAQGTLAATVRPQPAGRAMVFSTPQGEAKVVGTTLRIIVDSDAKSSRLDVEKGKVEFRSLAGKTVMVESGHFAVAAAGIGLVARPSIGLEAPRTSSPGADLVRRMAPNTWLSIPGSQMAAVMPRQSEFAGTWGTVGPKAVVSAWSGGALDTKRSRLILWGGGDSNYYGNELYAFDITSLRWARITDPSVNPVLGQEVNFDGTPNSRATYGGMAYIAHADRLFGHAGSLAGSGASRCERTWTFDFEFGHWADRNPSTNSGGGLGASCSYDPATKKVWWARVGLWSYDYDLNIWAKHNNDPFYYYSASAIDSKRGQLVVVGGGQVFSYDLKNRDYVRRIWVTTGGDAFVAKGTVGLDYDPALDRLVGWSGGSPHILDPDTKVWAIGSSEGAPAPTKNGMYGRWRYVPSINVFIVVTDAREDVYLYKAPTGG